MLVPANLGPPADGSVRSNHMEKGVDDYPDINYFTKSGKGVPAFFGNS